jgi:hypothetical protein
MCSFSKTLSLLALTAFGLLAPLSGCSDFNEALDCNQMCEEMQTCIDGDIDVHDCAERCEDGVEDNALADKLDACTDCLDNDYSCSEVVDKCSVCDEVQVALGQ